VARLGDPDPRNQQIDDSSCDHVDQNHLLEIPNLRAIVSKEDTPNSGGEACNKDHFLFVNSCCVFAFVVLVELGVMEECEYVEPASWTLP